MKVKTIIVAFIALVFNSIVSYSQTISHTVQRGETIASIARKYNITEAELIKLNPTLTATMFTGMRLNIPDKTSNNPTATGGNNNTPVEFGVRGSNSNTVANQHVNSTNDAGEKTDNSDDEKWSDFMGTYKDKTFSYRSTIDVSKYAYINYGISIGFYKNATYSTMLGTGIKKRILLGDIIYLSGHVGPYVALACSSYDEYYITDKGYETSKAKTKVSFTYGLTGELKAGVKVSDKFGITVGYYMAAPEFKFKGFFKNGGWLVGFTTGF